MRRITVFIAAVLIALGISVCAAWFLHIQVLVQVLPSSSPMQFNTALLFLISGAGLAALAYDRDRISFFAAVFVGTFAAITFSQYLTGGSYGLDTLFVKNPFTMSHTTHVGRMAPNTAVAFVLSSIAMTFTRRHYVVSVLLASLVVVLGSIALLGYALDISAAYGWGQLTRMGIHTATAFVLLGSGIMVLTFSRLDVEEWPEFPWVGVVVGVAVAGFSLLLWQALDSDIRRRDQQLLELRANVPEPPSGLAVEKNDSGVSAYTRLPDLLLMAGLILAVLASISTAQYQRIKLGADRLGRANQELQSFMTLFTLSLDLMVISSTNGYFKRVNPAFCKALGYSEAELLARPYLDFIHAEDHVSTASEVKRLASGLDTISFENRYICKDGSVKLLSWNTPAPTADSDLLYGVARDITEQRAREKERLMMVEKVRASLAGEHSQAGIVTICTFCKNAKKEDGKWQDIEHYVSSRFDVRFSGGYCPTCVAKHYPELVGPDGKLLPTAEVLGGKT